jgi:uncharacterized membrane protein YgaE (UPF0421/DUF939 family)
MFGLGLMIGSVLALSVYVSMRRSVESWRRQAVAAADEALTALGRATRAEADSAALAADLDEALGLLHDAKLAAWEAETATGLRAAQDQAIAITAHTDRALRIVAGPVLPFPKQRGAGDAS